jgi:hypothetical protein
MVFASRETSNVSSSVNLAEALYISSTTFLGNLMVCVLATKFVHYRMVCPIMSSLRLSAHWFHSDFMSIQSLSRSPYRDLSRASESVLSLDSRTRSRKAQALSKVD